MVELREAAERAAAAADRATGSNDELFAAVLEIERARSLVELTEARLLAELRQSGACEEQFGLSTKTWVARHANVNPVWTCGRVSKATRLERHFGQVQAAVATGALTSDHAAVLSTYTNARVIDALADVQDELIALAGECTFDEWRAHLRRLIALLDQDGGEPDEAANRLRFASGLDGMIYLDGAMTSEVAMELTSAVDAKADELYRRAVADHKRCAELAVPPRATLRMLALLELIRPDARDASPRAEVSLVVRDGAWTDWQGNPVPRSAAERWSCTPDLWAIVVDHLGRPLDVGRSRRLPTTAQRKAVAVRDSGCVFPGCNQPMTRCDVHHLVAFERGGRTDLDNLCALCRRHHTITHRPGWTMRRDADGFVWTTPHGRVLADRSPPDQLAA
jgi:hypothetical protein